MLRHRLARLERAGREAADACADRQLREAVAALRCDHFRRGGEAMVLYVAQALETGGSEGEALELMESGAWVVRLGTEAEPVWVLWNLPDAWGASFGTEPLDLQSEDARADMGRILELARERRQ